MSMKILGTLEYDIIFVPYIIIKYITSFVRFFRFIDVLIGTTTDVSKVQNNTVAFSCHNQGLPQ